MATEQDKADLTKVMGQTAAGIADKDKQRKFIASSSNMDKDFEGTKKSSTDEGMRQFNAQQQKAVEDVLPKLHKGGKVKKDGAYQLQKGETVLPKGKSKSVSTDGLLSGMKKKAEAVEKKSEKKDDPGEKKSEKKDAKKPRYHRTEIEHHNNGSHTVRHHPHPVMKEAGTADQVQEPLSYAAPDMASLHQGLDQNVSPEMPQK